MGTGFMRVFGSPNNYNPKLGLSNGSILTAEVLASGALAAYYPIQLGSTVTAALNLGGGTSSVPLSTALADKNFLGFWTKSTATSGTSRGIYHRHYLSGVGADGGEAGRFYTTVDANGVAGGCHGIHSSLAIATGGRITGLGVGLRATIDAAASLTPGGTLAALQADSNFGSGVTLGAEDSFIRFSNVGTVKLATLFNFDNPDTAAMFTGTNKGMKCRVSGTNYYIPFVTQLDPFLLPGVLQLGATATAALAVGGGTSASPLSTSTADKNFLGIWTKSTATTGDSRGMYIRHYLSGTGGGVPMGDCLRAYCHVDGTGYNSGQGAHITLGCAENACISGLGVGMRATLDITANKAPGGTLAVIQADSNFGASSTVPALTSFFRVVNNTAVKIDNLFQIVDPSTGAKSDTLMVATGCGDLAQNTMIRILIGSTPYWLMATSSVPSGS